MALNVTIYITVIRSISDTYKAIISGNKIINMTNLTLIFLNNEHDISASVSQILHSNWFVLNSCSKHDTAAHRISNL